MIWTDEILTGLEGFHRSLRNAKNTEEREDILIRDIKRFNYDTFTFGVISANTDRSIKEVFFRSNASKAWQNAFLYLRKDDVTIKHCLNSSDPLLWSEVNKREDENSFSQSEQYFGKITREEGYEVGVSIPLHLAWSRHTYAMSFSRKGNKNEKGHDAMFERNQDYLIAAAYLFFSCFDMEDVFKERFELTPKEWRLLKISLQFPDINDQVRIRKSTLQVTRNLWTDIMAKLPCENRNEVGNFVTSLGLHVFKP